MEQMAGADRASSTASPPSPATGRSRYSRSAATAQSVPPASGSEERSAHQAHCEAVPDHWAQEDLPSEDPLFKARSSKNWRVDKPFVRAMLEKAQAALPTMEDLHVGPGVPLLSHSAREMPRPRPRAQRYGSIVDIIQDDGVHNLVDRILNVSAEEWTVLADLDRDAPQGDKHFDVNVCPYCRDRSLHTALFSKPREEAMVWLLEHITESRACAACIDHPSRSSDSEDRWCYQFKQGHPQTDLHTKVISLVAAHARALCGQGASNDGMRGANDGV